MKAEIVGEIAAFVPRTIKITVESADDVRELWHRHNLPTSVIKEASEPSLVALPRAPSAYKAFDAVDELAIELGLRKDD